MKALESLLSFQSDLVEVQSFQLHSFPHFFIQFVFQVLKHIDLVCIQVSFSYLSLFPCLCDVLINLLRSLFQILFRNFKALAVERAGNFVFHPSHLQLTSSQIQIRSLLQLKQVLSKILLSIPLLLCALLLLDWSQDKCVEIFIIFRFFLQLFIRHKSEFLHDCLLILLVVVLSVELCGRWKTLILC